MFVRGGYMLDLTIDIPAHAWKQFHYAIDVNFWLNSGEGHAYYIYQCLTA
jgi:hypothetical protein